MPVNNAESRLRRNNNANNSLQRDAIAAAIDAFNEERIIAYPMEAVLNVGRDPDSETAVMRLLELKQRPADKGLILIAANYGQLKSYIDDIMLIDVQREIISSRWSGLVIFIFPTPATIPRWLTGRFDPFAVRVTDHPLVVALCQAYGRPLVSISANLSGLPPCRTVDGVRT